MPLTIKVNGGDYKGHAVSDGQGIFSDEQNRRYRGQFNKKHEADGYGVSEWTYGIHGGRTTAGQLADGVWHGYQVERRLAPSASASAFFAVLPYLQMLKDDFDTYRLDAQGGRVHSAREYDDGRCDFDGEPCDAADARFAELRRQALDAEVRLHPPR